MLHQDNSFIEIKSSYSYIGGDKSLQGLQEYLDKPDSQRISLSGDIRLQAEVEVNNVSVIGDVSSCNETSSH